MQRDCFKFYTQIAVAEIITPRMRRSEFNWSLTPLAV